MFSTILISCMMFISCEKTSSISKSTETLTSTLKITPTIVPTIISTKKPEPSTTFINDINQEVVNNNEVSNFQVVTEDDIVFLKDFEIPDYETISTDGNSIIAQSRGFFGGTDTNWYSIERDGIIYFFYQLLNQELKPISEPTYLNYAIVGEQYTLTCGIRIGMTEEEVYALLPDCINCKPTDSDGIVAGVALTWNVNSFPEGWCESYCDIIMANIEYGDELPWYLGIMLDNNGLVKAITTCHPTAG